MKEGSPRTNSGKRGLQTLVLGLTDCKPISNYLTNCVSEISSLLDPFSESRRIDTPEPVERTVETQSLRTKYFTPISDVDGDINSQSYSNTVSLSVECK